MRLHAKGLTLPAAKASVKQSISAAVFPIWLPGLSPLGKSDPRNHTNRTNKLGSYFGYFVDRFSWQGNFLKEATAI